MKRTAVLSFAWVVLFAPSLLASNEDAVSSTKSCVTSECTTKSETNACSNETSDCPNSVCAAKEACSSTACQGLPATAACPLASVKTAECAEPSKCAKPCISNEACVAKSNCNLDCGPEVATACKNSVKFPILDWAAGTLMHEFTFSTHSGVDLSASNCETVFVPHKHDASNFVFRGTQILSGTPGAALMSGEEETPMPFQEFNDEASSGVFLTVAHAKPASFKQEKNDRSAKESCELDSLCDQPAPQMKNDRIKTLVRQAGFDQMEVPIAANELIELLVEKARLETEMRYRAELQERVAENQLLELRLAASVQNAELLARVAVAEERQRAAESINAALASKLEAREDVLNNLARPSQNSRDFNTEMREIHEDLSNIRRQIGLLRRAQPVPFANSQIGAPHQPYVPTFETYTGYSEPQSVETPKEASRSTSPEVKSL